MRSLMLAFCAFALLLGIVAPPGVALAQTGTPAQALTACGSPVNSPVQGSYYSLTMSTASRLCTDASGGVAPSPVTATSTDASGTVTLGGTYQQIIAASSTRKGCLIQNPTTATEVLNVRVGTTTVFNVPVGGTFSCSAGSGVVISDAIFVTGATTGHAFSADFQ